MTNSDIVAAIVSGGVAMAGGMLAVAWRLGALSQRVTDLAEAFRDHTQDRFHNNGSTDLQSRSGRH